MDLAKATKATLPLTIAGSEYRLSPLTLADLGQFCLYCQYLPFTQLALLEFTEAGEYKQAVFDECRRKPVTISSPAFIETVGSTDGLIELTYLSLRHLHPEISKADLADSLDLGKLTEISELLGELSGLRSDGKATSAKKKGSQIRN